MVKFFGITESIESLAGQPTCWRRATFGLSAGAANRIRTCDPVITNDVLYQLSYCGYGLSDIRWRGAWQGRPPARHRQRDAAVQNRLNQPERAPSTRLLTVDLRALRFGEAIAPILAAADQRT